MGEVGIEIREVPTSHTLSLNLSNLRERVGEVGIEIREVEREWER